MTIQATRHHATKAATAKANKLVARLAKNMATIKQIYEAYENHINSTGEAGSTKHQNVADAIINIMAHIDSTHLNIILDHKF